MSILFLLYAGDGVAFNGKSFIPCFKNIWLMLFMTPFKLKMLQSVKRHEKVIMNVEKITIWRKEVVVYSKEQTGETSRLLTEQLVILVRLDPL
jgi:hypothetical protein